MGIFLVYPELKICLQFYLYTFQAGGANENYSAEC